jgi:hypothetical protein
VKIGVVPFCTMFFVLTSQKKLALRKWKMILLYKKVENSIWQHCLQWQDAPMCPIFVTEFGGPQIRDGVEK